MVNDRKKWNNKVLTAFLTIAVIILVLLLSNSSLFIDEKMTVVNDKNPKEMNASDLVIPTWESIVKDGYPINENGQTYGINMGDLILGELGEPDLLLAKDENGVLGYIYQPKGISSPNELDEYNKSFKKSVPLYLHDGKTIIGTFYFN